MREGQDANRAAPTGGAVRPEAAPPSPAPLSPRRLLTGLAVGLPVSAVFLWLASRGVDLDALGDELGGASPAWLAVTVAALAGLYVFQAERWRMLGAGEARLTRPRTLGFVVAGVAANNVIPGRPGEPLRGWWFGRAGGVPFGRGLATVVVDRSFDLLLLVVLLLGTLPLVSTPAWVEQIAIGGTAVGAVVVAALGGVWIARRRSPAPHRRRGGMLARVVDHALQFLDALPRCVTAPRAAWGFALSAAAFGCFAVAAWTAGQAVGIGLSPLEALFITAVLNLGSAIPSSPGFVGTYQWLAVAGLGLFAVPATDAFAFAVVLQASWFVPTTLAGVALAAHPIGGLRPRRATVLPRPA